MRRLLALATAALLLGGCMVRVRDKTLAVAADADADGWSTTTGLQRAAFARFAGRLAWVDVTARADDPYTPVRLLVRPSGAATVTLTREDGASGVLGAWRLTDQATHYVGTRVPRELGFGETMTVPAGTDLLVEFDPGSVAPASSLSSGDAIEFDVDIRVGDDGESVPVRLRVTDTHLGWSLTLAMH